jgi:hypothetical protein
VGGATTGTWISSSSGSGVGGGASVGYAQQTNPIRRQTLLSFKLKSNSEKRLELVRLALRAHQTLNILHFLPLYSTFVRPSRLVSSLVLHLCAHLDPSTFQNTLHSYQLNFVLVPIVTRIISTDHHRSLGFTFESLCVHHSFVLIDSLHDSLPTRHHPPHQAMTHRP